MEPNLSRRRLVKAIGLCLAAPHVVGSGCVTGPDDIWPFDPAFGDPSSLLTIDVHAHVFNGTDLPVREFVNRVASRQLGGLGGLARLFGGVLQTLVWNAAPTARTELRELDRLAAAARRDGSNSTGPRLRKLRQHNYEAGKTELQREATNLRNRSGMSERDFALPFALLRADLQGLQEIKALPDTYEDLFERDAGADLMVPQFGVQRVTFSSALKFVMEMFQYRIVSVYNYLDAYSRDDGLKIDLITPSLVDYDWWLAKGATTRSTHEEQIAVMKRIAILSGGRVHPFVPFDPLRQIVHNKSGRGRSPLDMIEAAIRSDGAIGVKLYPPMGHAPLGNRDVDPSLWRDKEWLPDFASSPGFPKKLDDAMCQLYELCAFLDAPVMGHSNQSNGPSDDFEALTAPAYWTQATDAYHEVALSFGHFGGAGSKANPGQSQLQGFLDLLLSDHNDGSRRLFADASYFSNLLDHPQVLRDVMRTIFAHGPDGARATIDRVMYGSDWKMLTLESGAEAYLRGFDDVISTIDDELGDAIGLRARFFGQNAADYLRLRAGQSTRRRLETFYANNNVETPDWINKVDEQPTRA